MTKGTVYSANTRRKIVAIATGGHEFTIVEGDPAEFRAGDHVEWDDDNRLGPATYRNVTKASAVQVVVRNHWVSARQLQEEMIM